MIEIKKETCFFCSEVIVDKPTKEHIISNTLLGKLGIKEDSLNNKKTLQYSRLKVPAHATCNNTFGSQYEERIINLLDNPDRLFNNLSSRDMGVNIFHEPSSADELIISTWLTKIYYGLFYNDALKETDNEKKELARETVDEYNFKFMQSAYKDGLGFCLPSSLFIFKSNKDFFDLRTYIYPRMIMIKIKKLIFILVIGDGYLTQSYVSNEDLINYNKKILDNENADERYPLHLDALSQVMALRLLIPKSPSFIFTDGKIINTSMNTMVNNPSEFYKVDNTKLEKLKNEILRGLGVEVLSEYIE